MTTTEPPPPLLRQYLAEHDAPCPRCGYNLRMLRTDICPECGEHLRLVVGAANPRLAAFLTGLIGLAAGAGFSGLFLMYAAIYAIVNGWRSYMLSAISYMLPAFIYSAASFLVISLITYIWMHQRSRFQRAGSGLRWTLASGCWAVTLASIIGFYLVLHWQ